MAGVIAAFGEKLYISDNRELGSDQNTLIKGTVITRHASEPDRIQISSATLPQTQQFLGVLAGPFDAIPSVASGSVGPDSIPSYHISARNIDCLIEDNATPALNDLLTMSATTAGTLVTAGTGERVWAVCSVAITSGAVGLTTKVDIIQNGGLAP